MCKDHAGGADGGECLAVPDDTGSHGSSCIIAGTADNNRSLAQSQRFRHVTGQRSGDFAGFVHLAQQALIDLQQVQQLIRPAAVRHIQQLHAGGIRNLGGILAGENQAQIVLRQQNVTALLVDLRLVVPDPQNLCSCPSGQCRICGDFHELLLTGRAVHLVHFRNCPLVAPDDGVPQHLIVLVQHDQTVHLSGDADAFDFLFRSTALCDYCLNGLDHGIFPVCRILFCIAVFRLIHGIFHSGTCHDSAVLPE